MTKLECPLIEKMVGPTTCQSCMYGGEDGSCLQGVSDTTEFARRRGVKPAEVELERAKAEQRIKAGLLLYEYASWFRQQGVEVESIVDLPVEQLLYQTPLADMGITGGELVAMADPHMWEQYGATDTGFRLAQVLLLTEEQYALLGY